ncbi:hypothetical protein ELQ90_12220 [Labedella phragmitis]|uniref:Uncharacterized protein n=1 Tax=Labedella phragmitis TaxID=2498849 RepID=A0A3S4AIV3_9MICO|nr:hypothetical protein [Labedella phragmitis]RWZ49530.1 hypothetical protein ELQ90_12220 [Labedella phragmitis]
MPVAITTALVAGAAGTITAIPPASTEASGGAGIVADAGPSRPTEIHTFVPGSSYDLELDERPVEELSYADCWEWSFVSARVDAMLCAWGGSDGGIIYDPCFRLKDEVAVCLTERDPFYSDGTPGGLVRIASQVAPPSFVSADGLVGAEQASDTRYPWSFSLDRLGEDGTRYLCRPMLSEPIAFVDVTFSCGTEPGTYAAAGNGAEWFAEGRWMIIMRPGAIRATSLDMSGATWTVQIADPHTNELVSVDVVEAWF